MPENAVSAARSNAPALMNASSPLSTTLHELLVQAVMDYAIYMLDPTPGAERIRAYAANKIIGSVSLGFTPRKTELPAFPGLL